MKQQQDLNQLQNGLERAQQTLWNQMGWPGTPLLQLSTQRE